MPKYMCAQDEPSPVYTHTELSMRNMTVCEATPFIVFQLYIN